MKPFLLAAFATCVVISGAFTGCGHHVSNATPEGAARSFFKAMSEARSKEIEAVNRSRLTTNDLLKEANDFGFVGANMSDYELTSDAGHFRFEKRKGGLVLLVTIGLVDGEYYANDVRFDTGLSPAKIKADKDKMKSDVKKLNEKIKELKGKGKATEAK